MNLAQYKFDLQKSPVDSRDYMLESVYPDAVTLPEVWDLRPQMRPVRDQGNQGTCSAQTAAAIKEWQELVDVEFKNYFSPQFIYNLRENQGQSGMYPRNTMEILYKIGIVAESEYPYNNFSTITDELKQKASAYKIQGYAQINTIDAAKKALFMNGPIYTAFPVFNPNKMQFWVPDFTGQQMLGGHAVCCAGYLSDCFIIRNSWSSQWGDMGYTYLPFNQWGMAWEIWTSIDADSNPESLQQKANNFNSNIKKRKNIFAKIFNRKKK